MLISLGAPLMTTSGYSRPFGLLVRYIQAVPALTLALPLTDDADKCLSTSLLSDFPVFLSLTNTNNTCTHTQTHIHTHTHKHIHIDTHTYTHLHIRHTCTTFLHAFTSAHKYTLQTTMPGCEVFCTILCNCWMTGG